MVDFFYKVLLPVNTTDLYLCFKRH